MKVKSLLTQYFQGEQVYNYGGQVPPILFPDFPSPTPSITPTNTPTPTLTKTPTPTPSISPSQTATPTITPTSTLTPTPSITPTLTRTQTPTPTITSTSTQTPTPTPTPSATPAPQPPLNANIALWYDANDPLYLTTANLGGATRVQSIQSKGYNNLILNNDWGTYPLQAPRYIPSSTYGGKNAIMFSGETGVNNDKPRLRNVYSGATANLVVPNGITMILLSKIPTTNNNSASFVIQTSATTAGTIGGVINTPQQILYAGSAGNVLNAANGTLTYNFSAYNHNTLSVLQEDYSTGVSYGWINYQQLENAQVLTSVSSKTINFVAMGGRYSFGTNFAINEGLGAEFYEMLLYDKVLTESELNSVYNYINAKYSFDSKFVSSAWTSNDIIVSGFTDYAVGTIVNGNNVAFGVVPSIIGNNKIIFPAANRGNASVYVRKQNTFAGLSKWYLPSNPPSSPYNTYGVVSQKPYVNSFDLTYGVRANSFISPSMINVSGCSYTDQTYNNLTLGLSYSITGTSNTDCGYTSATTWNTYVDYNSAQSGSTFVIQFNDITGNTNVNYTGVSTSNGIAYSGQQEQRITNFTNLNYSTAFTETIEVWTCDVNGNDIDYIFGVTGSPARFTDNSGNSTITSIGWFAENHFKIKYTAL